MGFTLIELLVVIAVIAIMAGGIGLALGRGDSGVALQNAQGILSSALSSTRSQAALTQSQAGLYVNVNPDSDGFLRELRIGYVASVDADGDPITPDTNVRIARGDSILLPSGVYIVPKHGVFSAADVDFVGTWYNSAGNASNQNLKSSLYDDTDTNLKRSDGMSDLVSDDYHLIADFSSRGTLIGNTNRVVLAPAVLLPKPLRFENPDAVRGVVVSVYGISSAINDKASF